MLSVVLLLSSVSLGAYAENSYEVEEAENNLRLRAEFIKQQVLKSAGVLNTCEFTNPRGLFHSLTRLLTYLNLSSVTALQIIA